MLFEKYKIFHQMCFQNAGNVISEPLILKIFQGACPRTPLGHVPGPHYEPLRTKPKLYAYVYNYIHRFAFNMFTIPVVKSRDILPNCGLKNILFPEKSNF